MSRAIFQCLTLMVSFALVGSSELKAQDWTDDSLSTVLKNIKENKAILVDVREKAEWDKGHIEGALFLPLSEMQGGSLTPEELKKRLPKDKIIYTHCVKGIRSMTATAEIKALGLNARALKPGYEDLISAGFKKSETKSPLKK